MHDILISVFLIYIDFLFCIIMGVVLVVRPTVYYIAGNCCIQGVIRVGKLRQGNGSYIGFYGRTLPFPNE